MLMTRNDLVQVFSEIVDESHWDAKKMQEDTHQWVDSLVSKCSDVRPIIRINMCNVGKWTLLNDVQVWQYISSGEEFADASAQVREQVCYL